MTGREHPILLALHISFNIALIVALSAFVLDHVFGGGPDDR